MLVQTSPTTLFSTVLFVDGQPVGYQLIPGGDKVLLVPDTLLALSGAPEIEATRGSNGWILPDTLDRDLAAQVLEDLGRLLLA